MKPSVTESQARKEPSLADIYNCNDFSDDEDDSDFTPDHNDSDDIDLELESVTSDDDSNSPLTPVDSRIIVSKRKASEEEEDQKDAIKRTRTDAEEERKARLDAIWADMNKREDQERKTNYYYYEEKQPLDDISSSVNLPEEDTKKSTTHVIEPSAAKKKPAIVRPKSNLSALVSQYKIKTPKMNTLEKSRLDWQSYVDRTGIRDELKYKNKDGYMEKVAFLQRVDDRRLAQLKAGQRASRR